MFALYSVKFKKIKNKQTKKKLTLKLIQTQLNIFPQ